MPKIATRIWLIIAVCFCRQPKHLKLQFTEHSLNSDLLSKFESFSTNLVHLELVCRWSTTQELLTDLTWLQGLHIYAQQIMLWYALSSILQTFKRQSTVFCSNTPCCRLDFLRTSISMGEEGTVSAYASCT